MKRDDKAETLFYVYSFLIFLVIKLDLIAKITVKTLHETHTQFSFYFVYIYISISLVIFQRDLENLDMEQLFSQYFFLLLPSFLITFKKRNFYYSLPFSFFHLSNKNYILHQNSETQFPTYTCFLHVLSFLSVPNILRIGIVGSQT